MTEAHRDYREQLGALALNQLLPHEVERLRAHLASCAACRAELDEIAPLAGMLRRVDPDRISITAGPPPDLGERISARIDRERHRTGRRRPGARRAHGRHVARRRAALVTVGALVATVAAVTVLAWPTGPAMEPVAFAQPAPGVEVSEANLIPHTWGTEILFVASGLEQGETYEVTFRGRDGRSVPAGTFIGIGERAITCELNAALLRPEAAAVTVTDTSGAVVLEAALA